MPKPNPSRDERQPALSRRTVFAGAGVAGAAAAVTAVLPGAVATTAPVAAVTSASTGGYELTEHVKRYYQTARV